MSVAREVLTPDEEDQCVSVIEGHSNVLLEKSPESCANESSVVSSPQGHSEVRVRVIRNLTL